MSLSNITRLMMTSIAMKMWVDNTNLEWKEKTIPPRPEDAGGEFRVGTSTYRNGQYCGPGWGFTIQDLQSGYIKSMPEAIDAIDEACRKHDQCYYDNGYLTQECNLTLTGNLVDIVVSLESTPIQRVDAAIMAAIFFLEAVTVDVPVVMYRGIRDRIHELLIRGANMEQAMMQALIERQQWGF